MRHARWLSVLVAAATLFGGCRRDGTSINEKVAARAECGHGSSFPGELELLQEQISEIIDSPEFQDCQRFIQEDSGSGRRYYDSLFVIIASQTIAAIERRLDQPLGSRPSIAPDDRANVPPVLQSAVNQGLKVRAAVAAIILAGGAYDRLGLLRGWNCLYVWRTVANSSDTVWSARMIPSNGKQCRDTTLAALPLQTTLRVSRNRVEDFTAVSDYPPVARWDWDDEHNAQYIGVPCGAAWCEIYGHANLHSSTALTAPTNDSATRRVRLIKGWYDQQLLATFDDAGNAVPSRVMGTIVPDPSLGKFKTTDFDSGLVHVADVALEAANGAEGSVLKTYWDKYRFRRTSIDMPTSLYVSSKPSPPPHVTFLARDNGAVEYLRVRFDYECDATRGQYSVYR